MRPRSDTFLVWTGAPCAYGCGHCPIDPGVEPAGITFASLKQILPETPARDGQLAVFVGGEPFLRPDFMRLVAAVRAGGYVPGIVTTGRPLVYPQLRERLRAARLGYLRIQFFGVGEIHDRAAAVPGAFEQAITGIRAWLGDSGMECDVDVALSTRGRPIETIGLEIEALAKAIASTHVQIVIALDAAARAELDRNERARRTIGILAAWNDDATRPLLAWEGLPEVASRASHLAIQPVRPAFIGSAPRASCLGPVDEAIRARQAGAEHTVANSFNYVRTETAVPCSADAAACTAHMAANGLEPARQLWLIEDEHLVLYRTDTGDFDNDELRRVKGDVSHLFFDRAAAGVLDDFTEGMRRVLPDAICDTCANRAQCGQRFRVVEGAPYAHEEAWIANYISGLRGRVLDVGCGEQLYRNELGPLVRSRLVEYTGLDPDESSLLGLRTALPEGRFWAGSIEAFRDQASSYDHILSLRSLNHVADLDEALARMACLLKPGGALLLVECTVFAMLRRANQVAAADHAPRAGHQHLRNISSEDLLPLARRHSLQVLHHRPATLRTTNEWILLLGRREATVA